MNKYAILDMGTNSIKFFLFSIENKKFTTIIDKNNITRLGEGLLKTGKISEEAMNINIKALGEFIELAKQHNIREITAIGTMCLRTAKNASEFIEKVKHTFNLDIKVLSGEEEANYSYIASISDIKIDNEEIIVFDTGGGSTEFIYGKGKKIIDQISLTIGAIQPTEKYLKSDPVQDNEFEGLDKFIYHYLKEKCFNINPVKIVGIGGTVTNMGAIKHRMKQYNHEKIQGMILTLNDIKNQIDMFKKKSISQRKKIIGLQPKRADLILAGATIVKNILMLYDKNEFIISDRGLRHGLMFAKYFTG